MIKLLEWLSQLADSLLLFLNDPVHFFNQEIVLWVWQFLIANNLLLMSFYFIFWLKLAHNVPDSLLVKM